MVGIAMTLIAPLIANMLLVVRAQLDVKSSVSLLKNTTMQRQR